MRAQIEVARKLRAVGTIVNQRLPTLARGGFHQFQRQIPAPDGRNIPLTRHIQALALVIADVVRIQMQLCLN